MKKLNLAIIGQGRSGKNIHGKFYISEKNTKYNVKYVVDADEKRREEALTRYPGCEVLADYTELFDKTDIDIVVNTTYNDQHYPITKDLLMHKFNVLVEKPFARNRYECDDLCKTAKGNNVVLAVFQQTFFAPYYEKAKEIMDSGILGKIQQIDIRFNGFSRRWDWQTLLKKMAGCAYNTGPHPIGIAFGLLDFDENAKVIYSRLACTKKCAGDAEDYAKILITAPGKPLVDVEISSLDAYSDYNIKIQGENGCYKTSVLKYEMKYYLDEENPLPEVNPGSIVDKNGEPAYCSEKFITHEESGDIVGDAFDPATALFYDDLYYKITEGRELRNEPEKITKIIEAIEVLHAQNPLPLKF